MESNLYGLPWAHGAHMGPYRARRGPMGPQWPYGPAEPMGQWDSMALWGPMGPAPKGPWGPRGSTGPYGATGPHGCMGLKVPIGPWAHGTTLLNPTQHAVC